MRAPENADFVASIGKGECPRELEPSNRGQPVHVNLVRASGPYVEPEKPAYLAFGGTARTLAGKDWSDCQTDCLTGSLCIGGSLTDCPID